MGLNQADLARMVGVSRPNVSFWENAKYPPLEAIDKICKALGIELWRFFAEDTAQVKSLPEKYSNLQKEISQLSNEEYEDLMNIIAIYLKKHAPVSPAQDACIDPQAEPEKRRPTDSTMNFIFSSTARVAAYNAIVNYTERFLRIM